MFIGCGKPDKLGNVYFIMFYNRNETTSMMYAIDKCNLCTENLKGQFT